MFCQKCGTKNMDGAKFCEICGASLEVPAQQAPQQAAPQQPMANYAQQAPQQAAPQQPMANYAQQAPQQAAPQQPMANYAQQAPQQAAPQQPMANYAQQAPQQAVPQQPVNGYVQPGAVQQPNAAYGQYSAVPAPAPAPKVKKVKAPKAPKAKSGKFPVLPCILAGVALVLVIVGIITFPYIKNAIKKAGSPEKYYAYVESNALNSIIGTGANYYDKYLKSVGDPGNMSRELTASLELGDAGRDILDSASALGMDMSWFKSINGTVKVMTGDDKIELDASAGINKDSSIATFKYIMDLQELVMYMGCPEINDTYMRASVYDVYDDYYSITGAQRTLDQLNSRGQLLDSLPKGSEWTKLAKKYAGVFVENFKDVEKHNETIEVEGISQKVCVLDVTISEHDLANGYVAVCEKLIEDKEFKDFVIKNLSGDLMEAVSPYGSYDPEDMYEMLIEEIKDNLKSFKKNVSVSNKTLMVMHVYVNKKGEIVGREIEMGYQSAGWMMPTKGGKFAFRAYVGSAYGNEFEVVGIGKKSMSKKYSGNFVIGSYGEEVLNVEVSNFKWKEFKKGNIVGTFKITLPEETANMLSSQLRYQTGLNVGSVVDISELGISFDVNIKGSSTSIKVSIVEGKNKYLTASLSSKSGKGGVSVPKKCEDIESQYDIIRYMSNCKFDNVFKKLKKAGVPSDYVDMLQEYVEEYFD